jgi:hypothetical protein
MDNSNFQTNPPFKVVKATYSKWLGGQPGVNGISINIEIDNPSIVLDVVYFKNNSTALKLDKSKSTPIYVGTIVLENTNKNYELNADAKKEYGNPVPDISQKIPFQLSENEAVVSYTFKNKTAYYKISNVKETTNYKKVKN